MVVNIWEFLRIIIYPETGFLPSIESINNIMIRFFASMLLTMRKDNGIYEYLRFSSIFNGMNSIKDVDYMKFQNQGSSEDLNFKSQLSKILLKNSSVFLEFYGR